MYTPVYIVMFVASTTIRLETSTKKELEALKEHKRETFDDVIEKLLTLVPEGDEEGKYSDDFRAGLLDALFEAKQGKVIPFDRIKKELGL